MRIDKLMAVAIWSLINHKKSFFSQREDVRVIICRWNHGTKENSQSQRKQDRFNFYPATCPQYTVLKAATVHKTDFFA